MYLLAAGYKTTAELIAESEQLKRRMERNNLLEANPAASSVRSNTFAAPLCLFALVTLERSSFHLFRRRLRLSRQQWPTSV